ncbi:MAG TPA: enoyl-CoA hydratase [Aeromonadales bacterium]|nr:enoyl-CoA hydratase [Aeromonadales bacterium]
MNTTHYINQGINDGILTLEFNRVSKKNAITQSMYQTLTDALESAKQNVDIKVVIFQGNGGCFTAGNDLHDFLSQKEDSTHPPVKNNINKNSPVYQFLLSLRDFNKPLLASVSGVAVGIGTTLLLHCDLVFADRTAIFSMPFTQLGVCAEAGSSLLLPQQIGYHKAAEWLLLGEPHTAEEALNDGLINAIVEDVNSHTCDMAMKLARLPTDGVMATRKLLKEYQMNNDQNSLHASIENEIIEFTRLLELDDVKKRVNAFLNR